MDEKYLRSLGKQYPNRAAVATEIINLSAILNLPKGTEHYVTDLHGEYEQFTHILRNGSGAVRRKIDDLYGDKLRDKEKKQLVTLICYPRKKMARILKEEENPEEWYRVTLNRLIPLAKQASSKYTRSKVRKALPKDLGYIMEELMSGRTVLKDQEAYYEEIFAAVIRTERVKDLIIAFCELIRRMTVDHLHVIGDIYDRGPLPHKIMDDLMETHSVDIEWGNHDVVWMGAASGHPASVATALRICARYGNLSILEEGYGISILPLVRFAMRVYGDDPCTAFKIQYRDGEYNRSDMELDMKVHKAISIIQFKLEGQVIDKHPEYHMEDRKLLHKMDLEKGTVLVDGVEYELIDKSFPTVDLNDAYTLTPEEQEVVDHMVQAFLNSERLQRHIRFLYEKGSLYRVCNGQLLFHGSIPLNEDGSFKEVELDGKMYKGKALFDKLDYLLRNAYYDRAGESKTDTDVHWFCWINQGSPLFGKSKMATFERQLLTEKEPQKEITNPYYKYVNDEEAVTRMLAEFGLTPEESHIINGHVPVKVTKGESPIKCGGRVLTIDGGFSKAYQKSTGTAGYTLTYNSYGMVLVSHEPFTSIEDAIERETDVLSHRILEEGVDKRKLVKDTETGKELKESIKELEELLEAYKKGIISER